MPASNRSASVSRLDDGILYAKWIKEPALRNPPLQRHLTTLEGRVSGDTRIGTSVPCDHAQTVTPEPEPSPRPHTLLGVLGALRWLEVAEIHRHQPSTSLTRTRCRTFRIMPRMEGRSCSSTLWPRRREPQPSHDVCLTSVEPDGAPYQALP